ncbi:MAG: hypothetical protein U0Y82_05435 [Thermoleophilia bacterium]
MRTVPPRLAGALVASTCAVVLGVSVTASAVTGSGSVQVRAVVVPIIRLDGPPGTLQVSVCRNQPTQAVAVPARVTTNVGTGYTLEVTRTRFVPTDEAVEIQATRPALAGQVLDLPQGSWRAVSSTGALRLGHRTDTITTAAGDPWTTFLRFGASSARQNTVLRGTVTYRVRTASGNAERQTAVTVSVRQPCGRGDR